jgi:hypothetical protein
MTLLSTVSSRPFAERLACSRLAEGRPRFEAVSVADLFAEVVAKLVG